MDCTEDVQQAKAHNYQTYQEAETLPHCFIHIIISFPQPFILAAQTLIEKFAEA